MVILVIHLNSRQKIRLVNHHDSDRFLSDIIVCVGALLNFVKTAMRRRKYACAMCPANLSNSSFERWIRDKSKLPACFDHHFSPPPPTVEVWFLVGPSWQILNKNNDANCKILFWLEPVISFCVFFFSVLLSGHCCCTTSRWTCLGATGVGCVAMSVGSRFQVKGLMYWK